MSRTSILTQLQDSDIPKAKALYERVCSGRLTEENPFGKDLLEGNLVKQSQRMNEFYHRIDISVIYGDIVNEGPKSFQEVITDFAGITSRLSERF